ncbi:unnamed protein product, partial [Owenia fusiformis]
PRRGGNWAHLMVDNQFPCDGYVTAWEYQRSTPDTKVYFGVWRYAGGSMDVLVGKTLIPPNTPGFHIVAIDPPIPVKIGDYIGIHYAKNDTKPAVPNSRGLDGVVEYSELFRTLNAPLYDEDFTEGVPIDFAAYSIIRSTHAVRAHFTGTGTRPPIPPSTISPVTPGRDECKYSNLGKEYMGKLARTRTGKLCQRWDSQTPNKHDRNDPSLFPDRTLKHANNYCRNPDNKEDGPWCYTMEPGTRWEYCDIQWCDCKITTLGKEYNGERTSTASSKSCQRWDSQWPHSHPPYSPTDFPERNLTAVANKCRNPDGRPNGPWCYTTDPATILEYCDVKLCECKQDKRGHSYQGMISETSGGLTCQRWDSQFPHKHGQNKASNFPDNTVLDANNYCRNPT